MIQNNEKGFTLVELLVTVGIIGILATITVASLSGTRTRARDAQRISDVKQLTSVLDAEFSANPGGDERGEKLEGCAAKALTNTCDGPGPTIKDTFKTNGKLKDPGAPKDANGVPIGAACDNTYGAGAANADKACNYSIDRNTVAAVGAGGVIINPEPTTGDYRLCFKLENASGSFVKGMNKITNGGGISVGCW